MRSLLIVLMCLFLLFSAVNIGMSKSIMNDSFDSGAVHSPDSTLMDNTQEQKILQDMNRLDGHFTENRGQVGNDAVRFYIQGKCVWFLDDGVVFEIKEYITSEDRERTWTTDHNNLFLTDRHNIDRNEPRESVVLKLNFMECNKVAPRGEGLLPHRSNFFYGNDTSKWCTDVHNYREIIYDNIYDKIDLRYYSNDHGLKYDFVVHPGGEPNDIMIKYEGAQELSIGPSGDLEIETPLGNIVDSDLFIYQELNNDRVVINGKFKVLASGVYGFDIIDKYHGDKEFIIDPLVYSTYIGGINSEYSFDQGCGIAVDTTGNAYVTGHTESNDFPFTAGANDTSYNGLMDVFVLKLNPDGTTLLYSTYIGGDNNDIGFSIAVDTGGNTYVCGITGANFPTTPGANDTSYNGDWDIFVFKLNPTGAILSYSTYVGGSGIEYGMAIAVDTSGSGYVTGLTGSSDFPTSSNAYDPSHNGNYDVVVFKLDPTGSTLSYSTFIGGVNGGDEGHGIAVDPAGTAYVTGRTSSSDFPFVQGAFDPTHNGNFDCFILKLNQTGQTLIYSTFVGGSTRDEGHCISIDSAGFAYVSGFTYSDDFPVTTGAYDIIKNGGCDGFILKINQTGSMLSYSTFFGGNDGDYGYGITVDITGSAYVNGCTGANFPTTSDAYDQSHNGGTDSFILKLNPKGSNLLYSTYIGGSGEDYSYSLAVGTEGSAYIIGVSGANFPTTQDAYDPTFNGIWDNFVVKIQISFSPLFLIYPEVTPFSGNTSTEFNFTVEYVHFLNSPPATVKVLIDSQEYPMLEFDPSDTNYDDGKKYFFNIKYLDIGEHNCSFRASNGTKDVNTSWLYLPRVENTIPKITTQDNLTAIEDTYYEVCYEFEDKDAANVGQTCCWDFSTNADWLDFDSGTTTLSGTPTNDDVGTYWVNIEINDTIATDQTNFTLTVIDVNDDPMIETTNQEEVLEDTKYYTDYNATDIDSPAGDQIWSLETNATSWLDLDPDSGILSGTPDNDDVGTYWVNVSVSDGELGLDFTYFILTVINVNDRPLIITKDIDTAKVDELYEVDYYATDVDDPQSELTWSLVTNATWLSIDGNTGVLNGTPSYTDVGWYNVNVSVDDGSGGKDRHEFVLVVKNGVHDLNKPPVITTEAVLTAFINEQYYLDYDATDDRTLPNDLRWSLDTNASWLNIDPVSGILRGTPVRDDIGWYRVNVSVFDGEDGWDFQGFILVVKSGGANNLPELSDPKVTPSGGNTETEFTFTIHYSDADGDEPAYVNLMIDNKAQSMKFKEGERSNGIYEIHVKLGKGEHEYYFTASDGTDTTRTNDYSMPYIEEQEPASMFGSVWMWSVAVIIIIIILIAVLLLFRRRKTVEVPSTLPPAYIQPPEVGVQTYAAGTTYPPVPFTTPPEPQQVPVMTEQYQDQATYPVEAAIAPPQEPAAAPAPIYNQQVEPYVEPAALPSPEQTYPPKTEQQPPGQEALDENEIEE